MPAGFTDYEKKKIKAGLIEQGRKMFSIYGLKKTTINDITGVLGIAQGSFYKFYSSKEELYFEILELEGEKIRKNMAKNTELVKANPEEAIKKILLETFLELGENRLFQDIFSGNSYDILIRKLPEERLKEHTKSDFAEIIPLIRKWQDEGILKDVKPEAITGLLHVLFFVSLHKKEIDEVFDDTFELLVDLIVNGLIKEKS